MSLNRFDKNRRKGGFLYEVQNIEVKYALKVQKGEKRMKIKEVQELLQANPTTEQLQELELDTRVGVQKLLATYKKRLVKEAEERIRFEKMLAFEKRCYKESAHYVAGVDEAGRGPLAGPLVIAAVILPQNVFISGLNDSKQLSHNKREQLYDAILANAIAIEVNIVSVSNIDNVNIYNATQNGMKEVIEALHIKPDVALIDAMPVASESIRTISIVHGDALSASIAAASVIAKVTRDRIMERIDACYPEYGFASNKGYGSGAHMQAVLSKGATCWHRRSFEPVKSMGLAPLSHEDNILYSPLLDEYEYTVNR